MKNCLGCKYAEWKKTKSGRMHPSGDGQCRYNYKIPQLPNAFYFLHQATLDLNDGKIHHTNEKLSLSDGQINRKKEYQNHCPYYMEV